jgi:large repetitive protein
MFSAFVAAAAIVAVVAGAADAALGPTSASFTSGGVVVNGTRYAKSGTPLTLTVDTDSRAACVQVTGAHTATQSSGSSPWTFTFTAGGGDGPQTVTVTAYDNVNKSGACGGSNATTTASYSLDNTQPAVTGATSPPRNTAGWNNANVTIAWTATDAGSGIASGPTPSSDSVISNTTGVTKSATASDRVGNTGTGSIVVKLDKTAPAITHALSPAPTLFGWNNGNVTLAFTCSDATSGIKSCPAGGTATEAGLTTFGGTAVDNADNSTVDSAVVKIDRIAPLLSGAPTTSPNANGWYDGDVTIRWTGVDNIGLDGSGLDPSTLPADTVIAGEGIGLTSTAGPIKDQAGNLSASATSPAVKIDRTAPNTLATAPTTNWNNVDVTVVLSASDALSGVAATHYTLDGGPDQTGTNVPINTDGSHSIQFWSVDKAGNIEAPKTVAVKIDKTPPSINHTQAPAANGHGWNKTDVTVTFVCNDSLSGVQTCTSPQLLSTEGRSQRVTGTALDNAGNTATDPATVSIDKTNPDVVAATDRLPNAFEWFRAPVTISFTCTDSLSGIDSCDGPKLLGEGMGQSARGDGLDAAGNSGGATLGGLNVDSTPPALNGVATSGPNADGWYDGDVTVRWTATDFLSGIDPSTMPADTVVTAEGEGISAGASVSDSAGNSTSATVGGLNIDRSAPSTGAALGRDPDFNGWYAGAVKVTLTAADGLSGVKATYYSLDGGDAQTYSDPFDVDRGGVHTVRFWSADKAGNVEAHVDDAHATTVKIDDIEPSIAGTRIPNGNDFGWNHGPVTVLFNCADDETGVASCPTAVELDGEGAGQSITRTANDRAGNSADATVGDVNIDLTSPALDGTATTEPNENGWYRGDVTVHWTAADALSGIDPATVPADSVVTGEGADLSTGVAHVLDKAGNRGEASVAGLHIDRTPPQTTPAVPEPFRNGWYAGPVDVSLGGRDLLSGVEATYYSVDGGAAKLYDGAFTFDTGGIHTIDFWSIDKAGNVEDKNAPGNSITLEVDNLAPTIEGARTPAANSFGWNNRSVSVEFSCDDAETGLKSCIGDKTLTDEGAAQSVTGIATDNAGNKASAQVDGINIDLTPPGLSGAASFAPNAAGWYNDDVTIHWIAADVLSGIDDSTAPSDSVIKGEGDDLGVGPVSVSDKAGNSRSRSIDGIKIDRTPPTISGAPTTAPNANGWYGGPVRITFSCADGLSGVATCPTEKVLSDDGADQQVTSAPAFDLAGNRGDGKTVGGINIDGTPPVSSADLRCTSRNDWCKGETATVVITAGDHGLSGVAEIHYSVDGGPVQVVPGATAVVSAPLDGTGRGLVSYRAVDRADNMEGQNSVEIKWDNLAPIVTHTLNPDANAAGWNQSNTTVHFDAVDELGGSGIDFVTPDVLVDQETAGQVVAGRADDIAGNTGTDAATVRLDRTPPTIAGAPTTSANAFGWYKGDVTVHFACADALSHVAVCPNDVTLTEQGAEQKVTRAARDSADNAAQATVSPISIDRTQPDLAGAATEAPNANGWYNGDVSIHWTASDALSGVDPSTAPSDVLIAGTGDDLGASASVSDRAGNSRHAAVAGIKIDRRDPNTAIVVPEPLASGWYADTIPVQLNAADDLSGVDTTYYSVDNADSHRYDGVFDFGERGVHTLRYWSVDRAGNVEAKAAKPIKIDNVAPAIDSKRDPAANAFGWNNIPVTIHFVCADGESGIAGCDKDIVFQNEGANQSATGNAIDNAGNTASTLVDDVNIDSTKPTLVGHATTDPNAAAWYNGDVNIAWSATDGLSGIDPESVPSDTLVSGVGDDLGAGPVSVSDRAGNSQSASVRGIKIDRQAPTIAGAPTTSPNAAGWYKGLVHVHFTCTDDLSGVAKCPEDKTLDGDGVDQAVTSDSALDKADNVAPGTTVAGIKIDSKAPESTAAIRCTSVNQWCTETTATIVITAVDQPALSDVKEIHYSVDGGPVQVAPGASVPVAVPLNGTGKASVSFYAVDNAGNAESANAVSLKYDNIAPKVTHKLDPFANAAGWNQSNMTVHFDAADELGGSGVDPTTVTPDQTINGETSSSGQVVNGQAYDYAHNLGADSATVKLDKTPPTISGSPTTQPNASGWYAGAVPVRFACTDELSGVAVCPKDLVLTANGADQQVKGTALDIAGNSADAVVSGINIDTTKPIIGFTGVAGGGIYTLGSAPVAGCNATDTFSGLAAPCAVSIAGGSANGVGSYTATATVTDKAGNSTTASISYRVVYRWDGFLQPINDTAHQVGLTTSVFKGGSTVPAKFQLKRADGTVVQANDLPSWLAPAKGNATSAAVDESVYTDAITSGDTYRWDATAHQYIFNWATKGFATGYYWRVGVKLDDGQVYDVNLGLR